MPLSTVLSTGHDGTDFVADRGSYGVPDRRAHLVADDGTSLLAVHAGWDLLRVRHLQLPAGVASSGDRRAHLVADRGSYGAPDRRAHDRADDGTSLLAVHAGWDLLRVRHLQLPAGVASSGDRRAHLVADVSANVRSYGVPDERTDVHSDRSTTFLGLHTRWAVLRM